MPSDLDLVLGYLRRQWLPPEIAEAYDRLRMSRDLELARIADKLCPYCGDLKDDPAYATCPKQECLRKLNGVRGSAPPQPEAPQA